MYINIPGRELSNGDRTIVIDLIVVELSSEYASYNSLQYGMPSCTMIRIPAHVTNLNERTNIHSFQ